uniref:NADH-ubiquinone oxidoreductase chain 6 n=1 Tax=Synarthrophyton chejuense TaxID=2485825 RepID=A0A3G3MIJ9_9FLOR|nr:NADH dehydrogenase subunit 6 [Synarthrophyton chejuense]AYR06644.1 NADH dehydrogenase subunit 6 [Synarthrophyton chejuense]
MTIDILLFYLFFSFTIVSSFMVITLSNAVHSVLFLIIVFFNTASLLLLLGAEFFSFMFLIVYVGAIAVLFLFVVMMLNVKKNNIIINKLSVLPIGLIIIFILTQQVFAILDYQFILSDKIFLDYIIWTKENNYLTNVEVIGIFLYTKFSLLFLLCGFILLVSMIGAIVLTMHQRPTVKKQRISDQLIRNYKGVVKFVNLRK